MTALIIETGFERKNIELHGSKFLMGNGYLGYRGTLEEFGKRELAACTLSGLYDQNGDAWREPVNAPNPFHILAFLNGSAMSALTEDMCVHSQSIDMSSGVHERHSEFDNGFSIRARRMASMDDKHLMALEYSVCAQIGGDVRLEISIDTDIWDINGPHLAHVTLGHEDGVLCYSARTIELHTELAVCQSVYCGEAEATPSGSGFVINKRLRGGEALTICVYAAIYKATDPDGQDVKRSALTLARKAKERGFEALLSRSQECWQNIWREALVTIEGDEEARLALMYSEYLLLISTPHHTHSVAIPGRGLSGQVYKGAMFWDTEIYMLPMYVFTLGRTARNLVRYRVNTLRGAKEKAAAYGYTGAFYAWESQETGDERCTEYNLNDVFTNRPIRTYFRDKQIHISADVVFGIWQYYTATGDMTLLLDGGAEVIFECARFLYSYSYFKPTKQRYELLDVTGADEYHERVNNDAYTNIIVKKALMAAKEVEELLSSRYPDELAFIMASTGYTDDKDAIADFREKLYVPSPDCTTGLIEQFDGYFAMEDISPAELSKRVIKDNEYWGSPSGIAVQTQVLKQADVVLAMALFPEDYTAEQFKANFDYYEPRTEHGSSLSTCIYALAAAHCGYMDYAYKYFMRAAQTDLLGSYRLYVGDQYIGGTHPAANGGSWKVAVEGFGGLRVKNGRLTLTPSLPAHWRRLAFRCHFLSCALDVGITAKEVTVTADNANTSPVPICVFETEFMLGNGETRTIQYGL